VCSRGLRGGECGFAVGGASGDSGRGGYGAMIVNAVVYKKGCAVGGLAGWMVRQEELRIKFCF